MFYYIQILGCKVFYLMYLLTILYDGLFSFVSIIFDYELFLNVDYFPWDSHVPWSVEVSILTRHLHSPKGFSSFWLVFMLIFQLGSLYHVSSGNLEPKPVKLV